MDRTNISTTAGIAVATQFPGLAPGAHAAAVSAMVESLVPAAETQELVSGGAEALAAAGFEGAGGADPAMARFPFRRVIAASKKDIGHGRWKVEVELAVPLAAAGSRGERYQANLGRADVDGVAHAVEKISSSPFGERTGVDVAALLELLTVAMTLGCGGTATKVVHVANGNNQRDLVYVQLDAPLGAVLDVLARSGETVSPISQRAAAEPAAAVSSARPDAVTGSTPASNDDPQRERLYSEFPTAEERSRVGRLLAERGWSKGQRIAPELADDVTEAMRAS